MRTFKSLFRLVLVCSIVTFATTLVFAQKKQKVVILINQDPDNYEADITIPPFADSLQKNSNYAITVIQGKGALNQYSFGNLKAINEADLLVVFFRRVALPYAEMDIIQSYIKKGKPVLGIRTANHAFSVRGEAAAKGHEGWWGFVPDILGHENKGYEPIELGTYVEVNPENQDHPILKNVTKSPWKSTGVTYKVNPLLDKKAVVLLTGSTPNTKEPIAWTRTNDYGGKVFYTSLGHPYDFTITAYRTLLVNAMEWCLQK